MRRLFGSISEMVDYVGAANDEEAYNRIAELCRRHGKQVMNAIAKIREKHDRLEEKITKGSLLSLIAEREYLKTPVLRLVEAVCERLSIAIPIAFQSNPPATNRRVILKFYLMHLMCPRMRASGKNFAVQSGKAV